MTKTRSPQSASNKRARRPAARTAARQARLAVDLPIAMHRQLKVRAAMEGKTIRDYIIWLLGRDGIPAK